MWIKSVQADSFKVEQQALMNGNNACLHQFELQLDSNGLICCRGRLSNAEVPESSKNPILLPSRHRFTELLIRERHEGIHHQGIRDTLNSIREQYWILKGREAVKRIINKCVVCKRLEGKPFPTPPIPDLPINRVDDSHHSRTLAWTLLVHSISRARQGIMSVKVTVAYSLARQRVPFTWN